MPPDPPSGQITLLSVQQSRFEWDSPGTRSPMNSQLGKKKSEMYEDRDQRAQRSHSIIIPAQVCQCRKFGCYVKILGEYNCEMLRDRFLPHRKTRAFFFRTTCGNGGFFVAASPDEWSHTVYVYIYIYIIIYTYLYTSGPPPLHQSWIRYWLSVKTVACNGSN